MSTLIFDNKIIGPYELGELLGSGGMGMVYRAYQPKLDRYVALKLFFASMKADSNLDQRFIREAEIVASLEHPHIVPIYDFGSTEAMRYVAMRLLAGGTLSDLLESRRKQQKPYTPTEVSRLLTPIADAIDYAHSKGIVHRDIKPSNIMFDERGWPYLVDFGIARLVKGSSGLTKTGSALGTPAYMPPEQWMGKEATAPSDVYALGAVIFEMLTLHQPFENENPFELMQMHINKPAPFPQDFAPSLSPAVGSTVYQALQKDTTERFPSAGSFAAAFNKASTGEVPSLAFENSAVSVITPKTVVQASKVVEPPESVSSANSQAKPERRRRLPMMAGILVFGIAACAGSALLIPRLINSSAAPVIESTLELASLTPTVPVEGILSQGTATEVSATARVEASLIPSTATVVATTTIQSSPVGASPTVAATSTIKPVQATVMPSRVIPTVTVMIPSATPVVNVVATATPNSVRVVPTNTVVVPTVQPTAVPATSTPKPPKKNPTAVPATAVPPTDVPAASSSTTSGSGNGNSGSNGNGNSGGSNAGGNGNGNGNGKKP